MSIFTDYKKSLKSIEVEEIFDLFFYRPLAFLFVKSIYRTNLTPNQITGFALLWGFIGGIFYYLGTPFGFAIGAIFYLLFNVFDCADGQLARLKKNGTRFGRTLDGIADYTATFFIYVGILIGYGYKHDAAGYWWFIILAGTLSQTIQAILADYHRTRFLDYVNDRIGTFEDEVKEFQDDYEQLKKEKGHLIYKLLLRLYIGYSSIQLKLTPANNEQKKIKRYDKDDFYKKNKLIIHLWSYLGPTTKITFLIICSFFSRFDVFFLGMMTVFNVYFLIIYITQKIINNNIKVQESN
jgi:phosphatidylglycerophosphate synthase